jgi:phenylpropionate dioxygenase-like ring-hydroxylating dioxygenase large terminal subunit
MKVPFTWKPTGWFMIGWSADFPAGEVRPLTYFGEDLVAWRTDDGVLQVMDAHCPHLGAHIGHGGHVDGDCVVCPYHGWGYGTDGVNRYIPYEDRPNVSKRLRTWSVVEQHECAFVWHQPHGEGPRWEMPDIFRSFPSLDVDPANYYRAYPELSIKYEGEPVHPQIPIENGPDSIHFQYVHRASVTPVMLDYAVDGPAWRFTTGWPDTRSDDADAMSLRIESQFFGVGGAISAFEGSAQYRLIFATTPVDDERSDMFYSIWWPRLPGDDSPAPPPELRERIEKEFIVTLWDDLEIWRYQKYVEHPALAKRDARPYGSLRKWAKQFYDIQPGEVVEKAPA